MEEHRAIESDNFISLLKITVFVNNIAKMSKNPSIEADLSQVLDDFLEKLKECDSYLENGIFNMNFAEAALLIQTSSDLYGKKVDLLWDVIFDYQKRLLLCEEQSGNQIQELEKVEERKQKYKRKRKTHASENETSKLVHNFSFGNVESVDYLAQNFEIADLSKVWEKFCGKESVVCDRLQGQSLNKNFVFSPNNSIYNEDNDYIGRYNQFHSTSLIDEIFHLNKEKLLIDDYNCITEMRIDSYVVNDFLLEKSISSTLLQDRCCEELKRYINNFFESHRNTEKDVQLHCLPREQFCKNSYVCLERLPFNLVRDKLRRSSVADSLLDDDNFCSVSEHCISPCHSAAIDDNRNFVINGSSDQVTGGLENRSKSCSQDSAFYEDMEDQGCNEVEDLLSWPRTENESSEGITNDIALSCIQNVTEPNNVTATSIETALIVTSSITTSMSENDVVPVTVVEPFAVEKESRQTPSILTRKKEVTKWSLILKQDQITEEPECKKRKVQKTKRLSPKALRKLATGMTTNHREFELFCRLQYKPADGEGRVPEEISESEESATDDNDDTLSEEQEEEDNLPTNEEGEDEEENEDLSLEHPNDQEISTNSQVNISDLSNSAPISVLNTQSCSSSMDGLGMVTSTPRNFRNNTLSDFDSNEDESFRKNVCEWRSFILPKLKTLENKADFDIHGYGATIIEPLEIGECCYFKDIVKGKNAAEVTRYFIATLQLANTHNIEIFGAASGEMANNSFQIKALDKTRHHERLEEYQAPSEETYKERLERVKALNRKVSSHSTDDRGPPIKKVKLTNTIRKKLF